MRRSVTEKRTRTSPVKRERMNRRLNVIPYQDCWGLIKSSLGVNDQTAQKNQSFSYFIRKTEEKRPDISVAILTFNQKDLKRHT